MFKFVFIALLAHAVLGCGGGEAKTAERPLFSPPRPTDLPEPCHAFGAAPEELVEEGCVFPHSFPYPGKAENLLRIALNRKKDQFIRLDDAEIVTDGIVIVELINNSGGPQGFGWNGDFCEGVRVELARPQTALPRAIELRGPLHALRQTDVIRRFVDVRQNHMASGKEPLWALKDGCYDTHFFFWNKKLKEKVRLCYTGEAAVKNATDLRATRSCAALNPATRKAPKADLSIRSWPFAQSPEEIQDLNTLSDDGISPLAWAAARGDLARVNDFLTRGAFADDGAVAEAALAGHRQVAALLLSRGARIDADTLERVAATGDDAMVRLLIEQVRLEDDQFRLIWAVMFGDVSLVKDLLMTGADVNHCRLYLREYPLAEAIRRGDEAIVVALLERGAQVGPENLVDAARAGPAMVKLLVASGVNPNEKIRLSDGLPSWIDAAGDTPLTALVRENSIGPITALMAAGADLSTPGFNDMTPLVAAADACAYFTAKFIIGKLGRIPDGERDRAVEAANKAGCALLADLFRSKQ